MSTPWSSQEFHQNITRQHLGFMRVSLNPTNAFQITDRFKTESNVQIFFKIAISLLLNVKFKKVLLRRQWIRYNVFQDPRYESLVRLFITNNPDKVLHMLESFQGSGIEIAVLIHGVHLLSVLREMRAIPCVPIVFDVIRGIENIRTRNFKTPAFGVIRWRHRCRHGARLLFV